MPLVPTLNVLSQITFRLDKAQTIQDELHLAEQIFNKKSLSKIKQLITSDKKYHIMSSHVATVLALNAIVFCRDEDEDSAIDLREVGELLLSMGGVIDRSALDMSLDDTLVELVRMELWFQRNEFDRWYEMAYRIAFEILPELKKREGHAWIDTPDLIAKATGIDFDTFWAITIAAGLSVDNDRNGFWFPQYSNDGFVDNRVFDAWCDFWSIDIGRARELASQDIANKRFRSFSSFYDLPLLRVMPKRSIAVRPWFLANKPTVMGFYNLVEHILLVQSNGRPSGETQKWANLFGKALEELGRRLIDEHAMFLNRLDEDQMVERWGKGKVCDTVLLGDKWLAIDFVFRRVTKGTATTGNIDDLARDLERAVTDKLVQIDSSIMRGIDIEGRPKGGIYPLIVIGAPFPINAALLDKVDKMLKSDTNIIGHDDIAHAPLFMTIQEFWLFMSISKELNRHPADIIHDWLNSEFRTSSFHNWAAVNKLGHLIPMEKRRYHRHTERYLFDK